MRAVAAASVVVKIAIDATHRPPDPEVFPGATAKTPLTHGVTTEHEEAWTSHGPDLETTYMTADPGETTLHQHHDIQEEGRGAQTMRAAGGEEEEAVAEGEAEAEAGLTNLPATLSTNLDRSQEHERTTATL